VIAVAEFYRRSGVARAARPLGALAQGRRPQWVSNSQRIASVIEAKTRSCRPCFTATFSLVRVIWSAGTMEASRGFTREY
jgi:hypothetical protein